jgi:Holliday junction DNA helicase RuvA
MISFLEGTIEYSGDKAVIINTGSIGYRVQMVPKLILSLTKKQDRVKLFIHSQLNMREGTFDMYGFQKKEDLDLFNMLISVSGIGPKAAMNVLATVEPRHLKSAVVNDDAASLRKISGLGPKTAQRLILELKNKIDWLDTGDGKQLDLGQEGQAMDALLALGYSQGQAKDAMQAVSAKFTSLQDRVREALKILGKK